MRAAFCVALLAALYAASPRAQEAGAEAYRQARIYSGLTGEKLDREMALRHLRMAAGHGHVGAQVDLGFLHLNGSGNGGRDQALDESYRWFRRAAAGGAVIAWCMLGDFHQSGLGGARRDAAQAFHWYQRAANQADRCAPKAQFALYAAYASGRGVKKDAIAAMAWLRKAAEGGNPLAQAALGRAYQAGNGVGQDQRLALAWLRKSREGVAPHEDHDHSAVACPPWLHAQLQKKAGCVS